MRTLYFLFALVGAAYLIFSLAVIYIFNYYCESILACAMEGALVMAGATIKLVTDR